MYIPASVSTERIQRGQFYEDCHYHPMLCLSADGDKLVGVSLVTGGMGVCSEHDCAAVPMTLEEAIDRKLHWEEIAEDLQERPEAIHWDRIED
jgi:hypothetical protein